MTTYYFSLLLVFGTLITGIIWAIDHWVWKPKRQAKIAEAESKSGLKLNPDQAQLLAPQSALADFSQAAFPVLLVILILRSFIYEPFRIPSGSMMPTLLVGDFIMVEKFRYGLREPVTRKEFLRTGRPDRGEVAVFKYPVEPDVDYIKRVIGLPGDRVVYSDKSFYIYTNCVPECDGVEPVQIAQAEQPNGDFYRNQLPLRRFTEEVGERQYDILVDPGRNVMNHDLVWDVPEGHYFFVGDNRDNSLDSRYWGFVHEDLLVGRAVFVWLSLEFEREPSSWLPQWVPTRVRFDRLGSIE
ncbi:signal peptidase I [Aliidiomarina halalkaliphila]|uniref:Signal peptidase I n=1 Tax=Aliidiomarina halalkaliphila TaxID=2593535 RepID=A0A552X3X5_9GAMM|nr:signal peptidase I [Aliidiomarina halalkaliphila]TRW49599.1 signal peptidase I [Aliidiomarina halalkaliphila]